MTISSVLPSACVGCGSCFNVCPKNAIKMDFDDKGFLHPYINQSCINCGLCTHVCPALSKYVGKPFLPKVFAVRIKDELALSNSTSGGFFTAISDYVLDNGGYVCGAIMNKDKVYHVCSKERKDRDLMRGAKYVQSSIGDCYKIIKKLLIQGKNVLFTGTPCQVHSLKLFLMPKNYSNLITIDIICHGVASPLAFSKYYSFLEKKYGEIQSFRFRSKNIGWRGNNVEIRIYNGRVLKNIKDTKKYTNLYGSGLITRESCFVCNYSTVFRVGDFSIGDFWGIEKTKSNFNDNKGCSLVFLNTPISNQLFNKIREKILYENYELNNCLQPNLLSPTKKPKKVGLKRIKNRWLFS